MRRQRIALFRSLAVAAWFIFTVSLAAWWFIFSLRQLGKLSTMNLQEAPELARYQRMLLWEGGSLFVALSLGGAALTYFMLRELHQSQALREFFAAFTHELKTPIASLRLQAEVLQERIVDTGSQELLGRLVNDSRRLTLQLENALILSSRRDQGLHFESLSVNEAVVQAAVLWPELGVAQSGEAFVWADRRALQSIFQNLLQNARQHGGATNVTVEHSCRDERVQVVFQDNGRGFVGDVRKLGKLFFRSGLQAGNGIGLNLVCRLTRAMGGRVEFRDPGNGFKLVMVLPKARSIVERIAV